MPARPVDQESFEFWASRFTVEELRAMRGWLDEILALRALDLPTDHQWILATVRTLQERGLTQNELLYRRPPQYPEAEFRQTLRGMLENDVLSESPNGHLIAWAAPDRDHPVPVLTWVLETVRDFQERGMQAIHLDELQALRPLHYVAETVRVTVDALVEAGSLYRDRGEGLRATQVRPQPAQEEATTDRVVWETLLALGGATTFQLDGQLRQFGPGDIRRALTRLMRDERVVQDGDVFSALRAGRPEEGDISADVDRIVDEDVLEICRQLQGYTFRQLEENSSYDPQTLSRSFSRLVRAGRLARFGPIYRVATPVDRVGDNETIDRLLNLNEAGRLVLADPRLASVPQEPEATSALDQLLDEDD